MGEKGNVADVAGAARHSVVTDTVSSGVGLVSEIATGAVTGVTTGVAKDKIDERLNRDDDPAG